MNHWMYSQTPWGNWTFMVFAWVFWIALLFLIFLGIARMLTRPAQFRGAMPREDEAIAILRARYAKGEIDKPEFEERLRDLTR